MARRRKASAYVAPVGGYPDYIEPVDFGIGKEKPVDAPKKKAPGLLSRVGGDVWQGLKEVPEQILKAGQYAGSEQMGGMAKAYSDKYLNQDRGFEPNFVDKAITGAANATALFLPALINLIPGVAEGEAVTAPLWIAGAAKVLQLAPSVLTASASGAQDILEKTGDKEKARSYFLRDLALNGATAGVLGKLKGLVPNVGAMAGIGGLGQMNQNVATGSPTLQGVPDAMLTGGATGGIFHGVHAGLGMLGGKKDPGDITPPKVADAFDPAKTQETQTGQATAMPDMPAMAQAESTGMAGVYNEPPRAPFTFGAEPNFQAIRREPPPAPLTRPETGGEGNVSAGGPPDINMGPRSPEPAPRPPTDLYEGSMAGSMREGFSYDRSKGSMVEGIPDDSPVHDLPHAAEAINLIHRMDANKVEDAHLEQKMGRPIDMTNPFDVKEANDVMEKTFGNDALIKKQAEDAQKAQEKTVADTKKSEQEATREQERLADKAKKDAEHEADRKAKEEAQKIKDKAIVKPETAKKATPAEKTVERVAKREKMKAEAKPKEPDISVTLSKPEPPKGTKDHKMQGETFKDVGIAGLSRPMDVQPSMFAPISKKEMNSRDRVVTKNENLATFRDEHKSGIDMGDLTHEDFGGRLFNFHKGKGQKWDIAMERAKDLGLVHPDATDPEVLGNLFRGPSKQVHVSESPLETLDRLEGKIERPVKVLDIPDESLVFKDGEWHKATVKWYGVDLKDGKIIKLGDDEKVKASAVVTPEDAAYKYAAERYRQQENLADVHPDIAKLTDKQVESSGRTREELTREIEQVREKYPDATAKELLRKIGCEK